MTAGAVELGGSHVSAARVDLVSARVADAVRVPLDPAGSRADLLRAIVGAAHSIGADVDVVGVAAPGPFDYERGICRVAGLGKLETLYGVDLRAELAPAFPSARTIGFVNDAEAFLLGEVRAGAARGHARAVGITLGTGLGSAFAVDGEIVRHGAGVPPDGNVHTVPFRGANVEDVISGRGVRTRFGGTADVEEIARLADGGDPLALAAFAGLGEDLAELLAPIYRDFRATCVVVGGSISRAWRHFERPLDAVPAELGDDAPLLGAAVHASRQQ